MSLQALHAQMRSKVPSIQLKKEEEARQKKVAQMKKRFKNQFGAAIHEVETSSITTIEDADDGIFEAVEAMNNLGDTSGVNQRLVVTDSALGSALAANKQLIKLVSTALEESRKKKILEVGDVLQHYHTLLVCLVDEISDKRIGVALVREEIAAYNAELARHMKCGVLCAPVDAAPLAVSLPPPAAPSMKKGSLAAEDETKKTTTPSLGSNVGVGKTDHAKAVFAAAVHSFSTQTSAVTSLTTQIAGNTTNVATDFFKTATRTMVNTSADIGSSIAGGTQQYLAGKGSPLGGLMGGAGAGVDALHNRPAGGAAAGVKAVRRVGLEFSEEDKLDLHFNKEETEMFRAQNERVLEQQQSADLKAAKEVEASVQQLSQLNALVSEKVFAQSEQLSLVEKNTEDSKESLRKAAKELEKPLKSTWNSTRMQIAFVWLNIFALVFLHWLIR